MLDPSLTKDVVMTDQLVLPLLENDDNLGSLAYDEFRFHSPKYSWASSVVS